MLTNLDHIAFASRSLEQAGNVLRLLGMIHEGTEEVPSQGVRVSLFRIGDTHIEVLEPASPESPLTKFLDQRGPGFHHVAFQTDDLAGDIAALREKGFTFIDERPRRGAQGKLIAFLHPRSTGNALMELCEAAKSEKG